MGYDLDGVGFEFRQEQEIFLFSETPSSAVRLSQTPLQWVSALFPGGKAADP